MFKFPETEEGRLSREAEERLRIVKPDGQFTVEEYRAFRGTTYDWEAMYPRLDDEALLECARHNLANTSLGRGGRHMHTYDEAAIGIFLPLLIERLSGKARVSGAVPELPSGAPSAQVVAELGLEDAAAGR